MPIASQQRRLQALKLLYEEINTRLKYLCDVGIGYLTLDRQSRTLSAARCSASTSPPRWAPRW
jgi:excinuclease UvrABC ATPase subunit